ERPMSLPPDESGRAATFRVRPQGGFQMRRRTLYLRIAALAVPLLVAATLTRPAAGQRAAGVALDSDDIGGVVTGAAGPEAGVWVIAETKDTATRLIKSVVTDD